MASANYVKVKEEKVDDQQCSASSNVDEVDKVTNRIEKIAINGSTPKSPVSELQEYLIKRNIKHEYKEVGCQGKDHNRTFNIEVDIAGLRKFIGTGSQKKLAKQDAASRALKSISEDWSWLPNNELETSSSEKSSVNGDPSDNPISKLNEFCAKNKLSPPDFALTHEYTPPNPPFFKMQCIVRMLNIMAEGEGSTKSAAKRISAQAVLMEIESKGLFAESPQKTKTKTVEKSNSESLMFMKMKFLEQLESIPFEDCVLNSIRDDKFDCNNFLMSVMNQKVDYLEIDSLDPKEYQCICQLYIDEYKEIPIFTTWGKSSRSKEEAKKIASRRAIFIIYSSRD